MQIKQKAILGYDPEKWVSTEARIRDEEHYDIDYVDLKIISPTKGKHKFTHCQVLYEEVHAFLKKRKWATIRTDIEVAGIIWTELLALCDLTGNRSINGQHQKNPGAMKRAEKENAKSEMCKKQKTEPHRNHRDQQANVRRRDQTLQGCGPSYC